ncbi:unnamed protein product [Paramecium octaurelia]|uniref:Uncharacterized protein n=1 Tax=Paramecium octaurelia TaxID=43137 RepID=A0A8S1VMN2_PAROT|nr:unnamed protein product [Paramecium octaurelia]
MLCIKLNVLLSILVTYQCERSESYFQKQDWNLEEKQNKFQFYSINYYSDNQQNQQKGHTSNSLEKIITIIGNVGELFILNSR